jgi:flagellar biosynthesis/type III secretory pathway protein FliH
VLRHHHRKTYHANHRFYEEGYNDGLQAGTKAGFAEGREFGVQTGYQRFLDLGLLQGRVIVWEEQVADLPESKQQKTVERLQQIKQLIHQEEPTYFLSNDSVVVHQYETMMKKAKAKVRTLAASIGSEKVVFEDLLKGYTEEENIEDNF